MSVTFEYRIDIGKGWYTSLSYNDSEVICFDTGAAVSIMGLNNLSTILDYSLDSVDIFNIINLNVLELITVACWRHTHVVSRTFC